MDSPRRHLSSLPIRWTYLALLTLAAFTATHLPADAPNRSGVTTYHHSPGAVNTIATVTITSDTWAVHPVFIAWSVSGTGGGTVTVSANGTTVDRFFIPENSVGQRNYGHGDHMVPDWNADVVVTIGAITLAESTLTVGVGP